MSQLVSAAKWTTVEDGEIGQGSPFLGPQQTYSAFNEE